MGTLITFRSQDKSVAPVSCETTASKADGIAAVPLGSGPTTLLGLSCKDNVPNMLNSAHEMENTVPNSTDQMDDTVPILADDNGDTVPKSAPAIHGDLMLLSNTKAMQPVVVMQKIKMEVESDGNQTDETDMYDLLETEFQHMLEKCSGILRSVFSDQPTTDPKKTTRKDKEKKCITLQVTHLH